MMTDEEIREYLRLRALHDAEQLLMWRCRKHDDCFSSSHISEAVVLEEANSHATTCQCWRHDVLRELDRLRGLERRHQQLLAARRLRRAAP